MTTTPEEEPDSIPSTDSRPLPGPDPDNNPDHPHGKDATLSGPTQRGDEELEGEETEHP